MAPLQIRLQPMFSELNDECLAAEFVEPDPDEPHTRGLRTSSKNNRASAGKDAGPWPRFPPARLPTCPEDQEGRHH